MFYVYLTLFPTRYPIGYQGLARIQRPPPWRAGTNVKGRGRLCGPDAGFCEVWSTESITVHTYANTVHSSICHSQLRGLARQRARRVIACEFAFGQSERVVTQCICSASVMETFIHIRLLTAIRPLPEIKDCIVGACR